MEFVIYAASCADLLVAIDLGFSGEAVTFGLVMPAFPLTTSSKLSPDPYVAKRAHTAILYHLETFCYQASVKPSDKPVQCKLPGIRVSYVFLMSLR